MTAPDYLSRVAPHRVLAAAQTVPVAGDVSANLHQHERLIRAAAGRDVQLLVFPELSLTGYELDRAPSLAFSETDARLAPLQDMAAAHHMTVVVGAPLRLGDRLHIGAFVLSPDRGVTLYTKHRLGAFSDAAKVDGTVPPAEATVFSSGDRSPLIRFGRYTAAVAVCADTGDPAHIQAAANRGADTYLASMFVIPSEFDRETAALAGYASRQRMSVVFANYGGPSGGLAAAGRSTIWSPAGDVLVELGTSGIGLAVARDADGAWSGLQVDHL